MKTWKVALTEDELKAVIEMHLQKMYSDATPERSARIHDLTKRLNKETLEIENDPRPSETKPSTAAAEASPASTADWKDAPIPSTGSGW
jgi:hypothetical protein